MKTTNKTIKKIFSIVICLALVMSYVPFASITAFAADAQTPVTGSGSDYNYITATPKRTM